MENPNEDLRAFCQTLAGYSANELMDIIHLVEKDNVNLDLSILSLTKSISILWIPPRRWMPSGWRRKGWKSKYIKVCKRVLRENSEKVKIILRDNHNDIATMVYSVGLVVGNQIIQTGQINEMTVVYTVLMYLAKKGLDKVLSDIK